MAHRLLRCDCIFDTSFRAEPCVTETIAAIVAAHRSGALSPAQTVARSFARIRDYDDPAVFISLRDQKDAVAEAESLTAKSTSESSQSINAGQT